MIGTPCWIPSAAPVPPWSSASLTESEAIGLEANPFAHFASTVKLNWEVDPELLDERAKESLPPKPRRKTPMTGDQRQRATLEKPSMTVPLRSLDPDVVGAVAEGFRSARCPCTNRWC